MGGTYFLKDYVEELRSTGLAAFQAAHSRPVLLGLGMAGQLLTRGVAETVGVQALDLSENGIWLNRVFELVASPWSPTQDLVQLGRAGDMDLLIPDHSISRKQCAFRQVGPAMSIVDLGSRNGTLIELKRLSAGQSLTLVGDETIVIGRLAFRFLTAAAFSALVQEQARLLPVGANARRPADAQREAGEAAAEASGLAPPTRAQ